MQPGRLGGEIKGLDSLDVLKVCLKRWYVVLPVLLLAAGAGLGLARTSKPTYTASAGFAFVWEHADEVGPREPDPRAKNPLAADGTQLLGESVVASLTSVATQDLLGGANRGYEPGKAPDGSHYSIFQADGARSYTVRTWADSPEQAHGVVTRVMAAVPIEAREAQARAGAPEISRYSTFETSSPEIVRLPPESPIKLLVAVMGVGLLAAGALALVVDRLLARRRGVPTNDPGLQEWRLAPHTDDYYGRHRAAPLEILDRAGHPVAPVPMFAAPSYAVTPTPNQAGSHEFGWHTMSPEVGTESGLMAPSAPTSPLSDEPAATASTPISDPLSVTPDAIDATSSPAPSATKLNGHAGPSGPLGIDEVERSVTAGPTEQMPTRATPSLVEQVVVAPPSLPQEEKGGAQPAEDQEPVTAAAPTKEQPAEDHEPVTAADPTKEQPAGAPPATSSKKPRQARKQTSATTSRTTTTARGRRTKPSPSNEAAIGTLVSPSETESAGPQSDNPVKQSRHRGETPRPPES